MATVVFHRCCQHPAAADIDIPVAQRIHHRFTHCLEPGEMDHTVHRSMSLEGAIDRGWIPHIPFHKLEGPEPSQLLNPFECFRAAVVEIVEDHQFVSLLQQHQTGVAANESGTTGDQKAASHNAVVSDSWRFWSSP